MTHDGSSKRRTALSPSCERESHSPEPEDPEISVLVRALGAIDGRLDELTSGQVDTVSDRSGRSYVLRRAQGDMRAGSAILDALPAQVALLDSAGIIVAVNAAWRHSAEENQLRDPLHAIGRSYLQVCDAAVEAGDTSAVGVAAGIRSVLQGAAGSFTFEYPCDSPKQKRWYMLTAAPIGDQRSRGAVVMHTEITAAKEREAVLRRFAAAMDETPDAIVMIDRHSMSIIHANAAACRLHACTRQELLAARPWDVFRTSREALERTYDALIAASPESATPVEMPWHRPNTPPLCLEVRHTAQLSGDRWTIVTQSRDISERKEADRRIAYLNRVYAVLSGINALIVRVRERQELFREACRIAVQEGALAMAWIAVLDKTSKRLVMAASAGMDEEARATISQRLNERPAGCPGDPLPLRALRSRRPIVSGDVQHDPTIRLAGLYARHGVNSLAMFPLMVEDQAVGVLGLHAREGGFFHAQEIRLLTELASDVAFAIDHLDKQERLNYLAYYDVLTGLANRTLFIERLSQHVRAAATRDHKSALYIMDLERFRNINATLGRAAGDALLRQVAQWLIQYTQDPALAARIDADRFAVILPVVTDEDQAARVLEDASHALQRHSFVLNGTDYRMAAKFGVAMFPDDGESVDMLYKNADAALRKAKVGGDRYLFYAHKMTETVAGRLHLENQLRGALERNEYVLHYQPKLDLVTRQLVGAEALIRWNDPQTGLVPPARFIPILEETGLIHEVGRWALEKALNDHRHWLGAGLRPVRIAINISALQLRNRGFIAEIQRVAGIHSGAAANLELEITESLIMEDLKLSVATLQAVRAMGVRVAVDDFGTGFSSLSYLAKLPIDTLKIDRSFVTELGGPPAALSLIGAIINLAHSLKLRVVAEGVETQEQLRLLRSLNCDEVQGFLVSRPLPAETFAERFLAAAATIVPP